MSTGPPMFTSPLGAPASYTAIELSDELALATSLMSWLLGWVTRAWGTLGGRRITRKHAA